MLQGTPTSSFDSQHPSETTTTQANNSLPLLAFQAEGVNWILECFKQDINPILADVMGLGKTIQAVGVIQKLQKETQESKPVLIVAPTSTLGNWVKELSKWFPKTNIIEYNRIEREKRTKIALNNQQIVVVNYQTLSQDINHKDHFPWLQSLFSLIVLDEGHHLKNPQSVMSKNLLKLNAVHKLMLTGTPFQNNAHEFLALLMLLNPQREELSSQHKQVEELVHKVRAIKIRFSKSPKIIANLDFLNTYIFFEAFEKIRDLTKVCNQYILRRTLQDESIRKQIESEPSGQLSLPKSFEVKTITYELTPLQRLLYNYFNAKWCYASEDSETTSSISSLFTQTNGRRRKKNNSDEEETQNSPFTTIFNLLRTVLNAPSAVKKETLTAALRDIKSQLPTEYTAMHVLIDEALTQEVELSSGKMAAIAKTIVECIASGQSILVSASYEHVEETLAKHLKALNIPYLHISGRTASKQRQSIIDKFNKSKEPMVMLLAVKAAGEGLNLQAASVVISTDDEFNQEVINQFVGRANRIGQKSGVVHYQCRSVQHLSVESLLENFSQTKQQLIKYFFANNPKEFFIEFIKTLLKEYEKEIHPDQQNKFNQKLEEISSESNNQQMPSVFATVRTAASPQQTLTPSISSPAAIHPSAPPITRTNIPTVSSSALITQLEEYDITTELGETDIQEILDMIFKQSSEETQEKLPGMIIPGSESAPPRILPYYELGTNSKYTAGDQPIASSPSATPKPGMHNK